MDALVSTDWLESHLADPDLRIVDASWHMPATGRSGREDYLAAHIPGAVFFDIDALSDRANPAPHMLPAAGAFGAAMEQLGIGSGMPIIVYDNSPLRSAARGWFMLRQFGARQVSILDGGLQKWSRKAGGESARQNGRARFAAEPRRPSAPGGIPYPPRCALLARAAGAVEAARPTRPRRPHAMSPVRETWRSHCLNEDAPSRTRGPGRLFELRLRSGPAVRCQLRLGRHRLQPDLRRAFARP